MSQKYSQEFKAWAVRLVEDRLRDDPGLAVTAVLSDTAVKLGVGRETPMAMAYSRSGRCWF